MISKALTILLLVLASVAARAAETNLIVYLSFEDDFSDGKIDDSSGTTHHAWRFGRDGTNYIVRTSISASPGRTNGSGYCGRSRWYNDGWGIYGRSGEYAGITNQVGLTNWTVGTIAVWARYFSATNIDPSYTILNDQNARILSTGTSSGTEGTWHLGRDYTGNTVFRVITNGVNPTKIYSVINFPDPATSSKGDTTNWHHYAVTFNGGRLTNWFDGVMITNQVMATPLTLGGFNGVSPWLGLGCDTHAGTPPMEDETGEDYPNHGWFNGLMDEVRIYTRAITSSEILALYQETVATGPREGQAVTARIGSITSS